MRPSTSKNRVITGQYRIPLLGEFWQLWGSVGYWYQLVILVSSVTTAFYSPVISGYRGQYAPWLNLPLFFVILIVGSLLLMLFQYKFVQPSAAGYWNQLVYDHGNPMKADINRVETKVDAQAKDIADMKKMLAKLVGDDKSDKQGA